MAKTNGVAGGVLIPADPIRGSQMLDESGKTVPREFKADGAGGAWCCINWLELARASALEIDEGLPIFPEEDYAEVMRFCPFCGAQFLGAGKSRE